MPSEIPDALGRYRGEGKIFYSGGPFPERQQGWLQRGFGAERIRSAAYSSMNEGSLGRQ